MRFVFILSVFLLTLPAAARAQSDAVFESRAAAGSMTIEEYDNVPKGLLLPPELAKTTNEAPAAAAPAGTTPVAPETPGAAAPVTPETTPAATTPASDPGVQIISYEEIVKIYRTGNFEETLKALAPLVKSGHPGAQELMGIMYRMGQGTPKDPVKAFNLLKLAADAGRPLAQHHLGSMYFAGEGTTPDASEALTWTGLAMMYYPDGPEKEQAKKDRDNIFLQATPSNRDAAKMLQREWLKKRGDVHLLDLQ